MHCIVVVDIIYVLAFDGALSMDACVGACRWHTVRDKTHTTQGMYARGLWFSLLNVHYSLRPMQMAVLCLITKFTICIIESLCVSNAASGCSFLLSVSLFKLLLRSVVSFSSFYALKLAFGGKTLVTTLL